MIGRGRWVVITGALVSRHRSKRDARATARRYQSIGAYLRRYHAKLVVWENGLVLLSAARGPA